MLPHKYHLIKITLLTVPDQGHEVNIGPIVVRLCMMLTTQERKVLKIRIFVYTMLFGSNEEASSAKGAIKVDDKGVRAEHKGLPTYVVRP